MDNEKTFKTKTGFCHILPDKIILTRNGIIGSVAKATVGNGMTRILIIYSALILWLFYRAYKLFQTGELFSPILYLLIGLWMCYGIITSLDNSATPVIDRIKIRNVKFIKGIAGLTRSRFEVFFEDDGGKIKRRMIMLPGSMTGGQEATEQAIKIMTEEKLLGAS
jgi:hypothetical protein